MENVRLSTEEIVLIYKEDVKLLSRYIPWLQGKIGQKVTGLYAEEGIEESSIVIPVYDSTLLGFVKEVQKTALVDKNYSYVYAKYRMRDSRDEQREISKARITEMALLKGILSKYILRGMTKGPVWAEGVENGIFLSVLLKLRELIEFYEGPLS